MNYYELFEISPTASIEIIESAYKTKSKKYHPDIYKGSDKKFAEEQMKKLNEAIGVLRNSEKRKNYDMQIKIGINQKHSYSRATDISEKILTGERRNLKFGKYKWRVLDVQKGRALMITEDIITQRQYNKILTEITWENCTLHNEYLNGEFLRQFTSEEHGKITETYDKIFLLSLEEVKTYFNGINDRIAKHGNKTAWWWLRSIGDFSINAAYVYRDGEIYVNGFDVNSNGGVRPALWIKL